MKGIEEESKAGDPRPKVEEKKEVKKEVKQGTSVNPKFVLFLILNVSLTSNSSYQIAPLFIVNYLNEESHLRINEDLRRILFKDSFLLSYFDSP